MHHQSCPFYIYKVKRVPKDTISIFMQPCIINIVLFKFIELSAQVNYGNIYAAMHHQSYHFYIYQIKRVPKDTISIFMQPCIINIVLFKFSKLSAQVNYGNIYAAMHHQSCPFYIYKVKRVSKNTFRIYMQPLC